MKAGEETLLLVSVIAMHAISTTCDCDEIQMACGKLILIAVCLISSWEAQPYFWNIETYYSRVTEIIKVYFLYSICSKLATINTRLYMDVNGKSRMFQMMHICVES